MFLFSRASFDTIVKYPIDEFKGLKALLSLHREFLGCIRYLPELSFRVSEEKLASVFHLLCSVDHL